jgi:hypothetical protein
VEKSRTVAPSGFGELLRRWRERRRLTLRYFTTLTTLGTPHDITPQELRIESFFPADEATEEASRAAAE